MHDQLLPLYVIAGLMFLYLLFGIARDAWGLLKYEPHEPMEHQDMLEELDRISATPFKFNSRASGAKDNK